MEVSLDPERRIYNFEGGNIGTGGMTEDEIVGVRNYLQGVDRAEEVLAVIEPALEAGERLP